MSQYRPMRFYFSPASIPQIVAHIEDYLYRNPIVSTETIAEIIVQALSEHPELLNGSVIPITEDSEQSIKAYIDSLTVDTYTKAQIDTLLSGKQNTLQFDNTPTAESTNPVTSDGINSALVTLEAAINAVLVTKANAANVYTKAQTDTLLLEKADVSNVYSKNTVDAMFETVPTLDDVYDKSDIDYMRQIDKANTAIVTTDGIAPTNISAGQYVYVGDVLYMATQAINQGDTVVPGTNAELNPLGVTNRIGDGLQNVAGAVSSLSQQITNLQAAAAYVEDGDTATKKTYAEGEFIVWKGLLYTVNSGGIPLGTTINGHVTAVDGGGFNSIYQQINDYIENTSSIRKVTGVISQVFNTVGVQIDTTRLIFFVTLPFTAANTDYTVEVISGGILGVRDVPVSEIHIDLKNNWTVRMYFDNQGTVGNAYLCSVNLRITL